MHEFQQISKLLMKSQTPEWLCGTVFHQIYPQSFANSNISVKSMIECPGVVLIEADFSQST